MMCYPSIDSLVKKVDSKYTLVTLAAMRSRELTDGQLPLIANAEGKKRNDGTPWSGYHDYFLPLWSYFSKVYVILSS